MSNFDPQHRRNRSWPDWAQHHMRLDKGTLTLPPPEPKPPPEPTDRERELYRIRRAIRRSGIIRNAIREFIVGGFAIGIIYIYGVNSIALWGYLICCALYLQRGRHR